MSNRNLIVFVSIGIAVGYLMGTSVGGGNMACPPPLPAVRVPIAVPGPPKECPKCPSCPAINTSPKEDAPTPAPPIETPPPQPPAAVPSSECSDIDSDAIHWVSDHFASSTPITRDPIPLTDNTDFVYYHDRHVHNYGRMTISTKKEDAWLVVYVPTAVGFGADQQSNFMVGKSVVDKGQPSGRRTIVRENFRKSWLYRNNQAKLWFVLSSRSPLLNNADFKSQIDEEQKQFGDLLFVDCPDVDTDFNPPSGTTIKMGYAFQHAYANYNYNYFARGSDDVHFNIDQLYRLIVIHKTVPAKRLFMGKRWINMGVRTEEQRKRFGAHYPAYPQGLGYVLSADVAIRLGKMVQMGVPFLTDWPEDAIVASWVTGWGVNIIDSLRWFHNKQGSGGPEFACVADAIMTHDLSPAQLRQVDSGGVWRC